MPTSTSRSDIALVPAIPDRAIRHGGYQEALAYVFGFSPTARPAAAILQDRPRKLPRMRELLARLGNPERQFDSILVAGTKGKGSTAAMLESILRTAGHATGLYSQPHLHSWRERTRFDGRLIEPDEVVELMPRVRAAVADLERERPELGPPTTFEVGTAFSFLAFAQHGVRLAVVEVGVGGTHDATNAVDPSLVVLTPISLDHVETLGGSLESIATEKAGLFRPRELAVVGRQPPRAFARVKEIAAERETPLQVVGRDWSWRSDGDPASCGRFTIDGPGQRLDGLEIPLLGRHQRDNATLAVAAASVLTGGDGGSSIEVSSQAIRRGLADVIWPGRLQVLHEHPWLVVDGAHNGESARCLVQALLDCFDYRRLHLILGLSQGKDVDGMLDAFLPAADRLTLTVTRHYRAYPLAALAEEVRARRGTTPHCAPDVGVALRHALGQAQPDDLICVAGSLFLAAEAIEVASGAGSHAR